jgi:hypothetical protein
MLRMLSKSVQTMVMIRSTHTLPFALSVARICCSDKEFAVELWLWVLFFPPNSSIETVPSHSRKSFSQLLLKFNAVSISNQL